MDDSRYNPPKTALVDIDTDVPGTVPDAVLKKIRNAWIAALVSAAVTLGVTLLALSGTHLGPYSGAELIDVVFILLLAFGIRRKSRACAVLMFGYFLVSKIILIWSTGQAGGVLLGVVFLYYYALGVQGTFEYHKLRKNG